MGRIEGGRLVEEEVSLGRPASRGDGRRPVGQLKMEKDGGYAEFGIVAIELNRCAVEPAGAFLGCT